MIFSLLKLRKKTTAIIAGITIAALCLWGVAMWQDISAEEMLNILFATLIMLGAIMLAAFLLIATFKLASKLLQRVLSNFDEEVETDKEA